jgi:hypothetical protein
MHMAVSLAKLLDAFEIMDVRGVENVVYLCRQTGETFWQSDFPDFEELQDELPDDIEDETKYVQVPDRYDLDLGKALVFDFAREFLPNDCDDIRDFLRKRGGYRRFRALLERRRLLQRWYDFEQEAIRKALRDWCELHGIELTE